MRVVITAAGGISYYGTDTINLISAFRKDFPQFESQFDQHSLGIKDFELKNYIGRFKNHRYLSRGAKLALAAAYTTVKNNNIDLIEDCGLFVGTGPNLDIPDSGMNYSEQKALWILEHLPNTVSSSISSLLNIHGENSTIATACSASLQAIGEGFRRIKHGYTNMALVGGGDSRISIGGIAGYKKAGVLYSENNPSNDYSPLRGEPKGFVPGEGAAFFILENLEHAIKNNRHIIAEVLGYGCSMDAYRMTSPELSGLYQKKAIEAALKESNLSPLDIGVISAHGTGTYLNDKVESYIIKSLFNNNPYIATFKEWFGHLSAACGAMELWATLACMENNFFPRKHRSSTHKIGSTHPLTNYGLLQNFGFGGQNAALVIKKWSK